MNERYFINSLNSVYYTSFAHNAFVNDLTEGGFLNLVRNHKLDTPNNLNGGPPYEYAGWDLDLATDIVIEQDFRTIQIEPTETFEQDLTWAIEPNKDYTILFHGYLEAGGPFEVQIVTGPGDAVNVDAPQQTLGTLSVIIDEVRTEPEVTLLRIKTAEGNLSPAGFFLRIAASGSSTIKFERLVVTEGKVGLLNARPHHRFLQNIRYNTPLGIWEMTNDGVNWFPLLVGDPDSLSGVIGGMVEGNIESGIEVTYDGLTNKLNFDTKDPRLIFSGDVEPIGIDPQLNLDAPEIEIPLNVKDDSHSHRPESLLGRNMPTQIPLGGTFDKYIIAVVEDAGITGSGGPVDLSVQWQERTTSNVTQTVNMAPLTWNAGQIAIYVDGVRQPPNSYLEHVPTTGYLTFVEALPIGTHVLAITMDNLPTYTITTNVEYNVSFADPTEGLNWKFGIYNLPFSYFTNQLAVYVNGVRQTQQDYVETGPNQITFNYPAVPQEGDRVYCVAIEDSGGQLAAEYWVTDNEGDLMPKP